MDAEKVEGGLRLRLRRLLRRRRPLHRLLRLRLLLRLRRLRLLRLLRLRRVVRGRWLRVVVRYRVLFRRCSRVRRVV